jgi:hypothetical protein
MENYTHIKEESEVVISEDLITSIRESVGVSSYPDYSEMLEELVPRSAGLYDDDPSITAGAEWFCRAIDASVLDQLEMISRMKTLRKVIYGKRRRKNFRNLRKVKTLKR